MPFQSKAQERKCFAMRDRGQAKGWNCEEWAHKTKSIKKLPEHVKSAARRLGQAQRSAEAALPIHLKLASLAASIALGHRTG